MTEEIRDYRDTLQLPQTEFAMKAGLPKREPELLAHWQKLKLYERLREQSKAENRPPFTLHDGPPYANGDIHIGHALNKILKDMVVKSHQMMGYDATFIPGWDCHGLPIEWKIEEQYRKAGKDKDAVPMAEFRAECRRFAEKWVGVQSEQFQRLGVLADWENEYTTMKFDAEAVIVRQLQKFIMDGSLYRGSKPVLWSCVEKTALAEAEVEYEEYVSQTCFVKFPLNAMMGSAANPENKWNTANTFAVIWTTTPWTLPANRAIAFSEELDYGVYNVGEENYILADNLAERVFAAAEIENYERLSDFDTDDFNTIFFHHPLYKQDDYYNFGVLFLPADFVTDETGTGLVHIAPGHGQDDFNLVRQHNLFEERKKIEFPFTIDEAGAYLPHIPLFAGIAVYNEKGKGGGANKAVLEELNKVGAVLATGKLRHQYPHSWRSKAPLIYRNTPQWFISMTHNNLRDKALAAIDATEFYPQSGRNRIKSMVETRPDWVLSRQRAWGVPLTLFVNKASGELLRDDAVNDRIAAAVEKEGADAWFNTPAQKFLGDKYEACDYEQVQDILDVWFDSGASYAFVLQARGLQTPADVYLEGSDQHRGWFQSSLLESVATQNHAPYKNIVTHGFTLDDKGHKMLKSGSNAIDPQKIIAQQGADIIRLWVASSDYAHDTRVGADIIKANTDAYRKIRNCFRFLLGNLAGFDDAEKLELNEMPEIEQYIAHRLHELDAQVRAAYKVFDYRLVYQLIFNFMTIDLSSFYFDIRKDSLYCDHKTFTTRRAARSMLDILFYHLTALCAPILSFTAEEVWQSRFGDANDSIHLKTFPTPPEQWHNPELAAKWERLREIRRVVNGALEIERQNKTIGSSLEAAPKTYITDAATFALAQTLNADELADLCITSQIELINAAPPSGAKNIFTLENIADVAVEFAPAQGKKCQRSWKILPDVGSDPAYPDLSPRCAKAVALYDKQK